MEPWEKEQMFYDELHATIEHFLIENSMTFFQVMGALEQVKIDYSDEFKNAGDILLDEDDE
jgi:hypothetical protein